MFSRQLTRNSNYERPVKPISIRLARVAFPVLALLACLRPAKSFATSDGAPAGGAAAISGASLPAEARTAAPFDSASGPANLSDQPSGSTTPGFSASDSPYYLSDPPSA